MNDVNGKKKPGFGRFLFGRAVFFLLFTLVQIFTLIGLFLWIDERYSAYGYSAMAVLGAILAIHILNEKQNASFKMAWLVPVLLFPVFGGLFYMFVQLQMEPKILAKRIADIHSRTKHYLPQNQSVFKKLKKESRSNANLAKYLFESGGAPVYENTNYKYYPLGDHFFEDMLVELKHAKQFVFLEYFIIQPGHMWDSMLDILESKVKEGVEVRVLYDGTNTVGNLPPDYRKMLEAKGIRCRVFNPVRPAISTSQNTRDHRKILVIDGKIAYTGGVNLADEYINRKVRFGHWKDNAICVRGDAVRSFVVMFLPTRAMVFFSPSFLDLFRPMTPRTTPAMHISRAGLPPRQPHRQLQMVLPNRPTIPRIMEMMPMGSDFLFSATTGASTMGWSTTTSATGASMEAPQFAQKTLPSAFS